MGSDINSIDREILELLSRRVKCGIDSGIDPLSASEKARLAGLVTGSGSPIPEEGLERIFTEIASASSALSRPLRVAFLGPFGTFSSIAVREIFGGSIETSPERTIADVFREVETGGAHCGVVPVENSSEGAVVPTLDELLSTGLTVEREKYLRVSFALLSLETSIEEVKKVFTFGQPLGQCRGWLRAHLPAAEIIPVDSTARAAECARSERGSAAIASEIAAEIYSLNIVEKHIEDSRRNFTRFFVMGTQKTGPTARDKTSIVCAIKDRPGALLDMLRPLSDAGINMTRIESRPDKNKLWEYNFFIDICGHETDDKVRTALEEMGRDTLFLKILGSYPAGAGS